MMKIRHGFVSNSSSSSFAVILPKDFDPYTYDFTKLPEWSQYEEEDLAAIQGEMERLIKEGSLWDEEMSYCYIIDQALDDVGYIVCSFEGGPDMGQRAVVDGEALLRFLTTGEKPKREGEELMPVEEAERIMNKIGIEGFLVDNPPI